MCLVQGACIKATADKIDQLAINKAITNLRSEFIRPMPQAYSAERTKIHQSDDTYNTPDHRSILFYRFALEYNGNRWVDVSPLIYEVAEFQTVLKSSAGGKKAKNKKLKNR